MNLQKNALPTLAEFSFLIVTAARDENRLREAYRSIRLQYPENEIVVVYDNTGVLLLNREDINLLEIPTSERVYVSRGYNIALKNCSKPYFVFLHDDTFIAPNFLENILPHISESQFCNFTAIEPPVFGNIDSATAPIRDFGRSLDTFVVENFNKYTEKYVQTLEHRTVESPFGGFFMVGSTKSILSIGGFDETFQPYFFEDSDLMVRLHLANFRFIQVLDSLVYHMVSLTSRGTPESRVAESITHKLFVKKWKVEFNYFRQYTMSAGIPYKKIPVLIKHTNCSESLQEYLSLISEPSTVELIVDGLQISQEDVGYIQSLPYIIQDTILSGSYQLGSMQLNFN
jgi:GT2 family glycosyltransferase